MSDDQRPLGRRLAELAIPDADGARERAHARIQHAVTAAGAARPRHARPALRIALGLAIAALLAGVAVAATDSSVTRLVRDAVTPASKRPAQAVAQRLPSSGSLLVRRFGEVAVVHADGSLRTLGAFREASWSPHGRFVVMSGGRHLVVIDPHTGKQRWTITARAPIHGARWSLEPTVPPCCRIAYLTTGATPRDGSLRVIAGDGTGDHVLARADGRVAPAWRPGSRSRELAFIDAAGRLRRISADTGRDVAPPTRISFPADRLAWSADGARLLVLGDHRLVVYDVRAATVARLLLAAEPDRLIAATFLGTTRSLTVLRRVGVGRSEIELLPPRGVGITLATSNARLSWLAASPIGTSILAGTPNGHTWLDASIRQKETRAGAATGRTVHPVAVVLDHGWAANE